PVPLPGPFNIAFLLSGLCMVPWAFRKRNSCASLRLLLCLMLLGLGAFIYKEASQEETSGALTVTALDVGQGDALLIDFPDGKVALLDGGGFVANIPDTGKRVVLPVLRARGIEFLDLVILSRPPPARRPGL